MEIRVMKKIVLATAAAFFASVITAAAMPAVPMGNGVSDNGVIQVKSKKMGHMPGMKGGKGMKGHSMKGESMKGMKGM
jgi:Spy/CpxP family protein refolding chaperone